MKDYRQIGSKARRVLEFLEKSGPTAVLAIRREFPTMDISNMRRLLLNAIDQGLCTVDHGKQRRNGTTYAAVAGWQEIAAERARLAPLPFRKTGRKEKPPVEKKERPAHRAYRGVKSTGKVEPIEYKRVNSVFSLGAMA